MKCRASLAKWKKAASTKVCSMSAQICREICLPGVVTPTNGAMPKLSPWKIRSQNLERFCKYDQKFNT